MNQCAARASVHYFAVELVLDMDRENENAAEQIRLDLLIRLPLPQQLRQLGDIYRNPSRLILAEQLGGRAPLTESLQMATHDYEGFRLLIDQ
jgi:hypothetical protein